MRGSQATSVIVELKDRQGEFELDVALELPGGGISVLFGPSGCGKTTLLRAIAGLSRAGGRVSLGEECWQADDYFRPVHERALGYVFQEANLFPHLSVRKNLEYGYRRLAPSARRVLPDQVIEWLGLEALLARRPGTLSGGERQRVAIGRALLTSPRLLLMDEPLSALDHQSKQEILPYLERLHRQLSIPVIYVTHSPDEVARLADYLVVMEQGRVRAAGTLERILPDLDLPVRLGGGGSVVFPATVSGVDRQWHLCKADFSGGSLWVPDHGHELGQSIRLRVLAKDVSIALSQNEAQSIQNVLPGVIRQISADTDPGIALLKLDVGGTALLASITARAVDQLGLRVGLPVWAQLKSVAVLE
jgi:molybdate transport system ATP-binding protein